MDLDFAREQTKASARYERSHPVSNYPPPPQHVQAQQAQHLPPPPPPHGHQQGYGPYYGLAPVQQQVLARFNYPPHYGGQQSNHPPPSSPSVPYPHSAHPLCTSTDRVQQLRQLSPTSPAADEINNKKRNRSSISSSNEQLNDQQQDKLSHNKVMEALKAKIQRGNGGPPSPLTASPIIPQDAQNKKRKPTLPRPVIVHSTTISSPSPSPRSAKPVLPPIDTNLGRIDIIKLDTSSSSSSSSSNNSNKSVKQDTITTTTTVAAASPSDHILLNTRRARSLSPSSSSLLVKKA